MSRYEALANRLHQRLCGECAHAVTFEQKLVEALKRAYSKGHKEGYMKAVKDYE